MLTFKEFKATGKPVVDLGPETSDSSLEGMPGIMYAEHCFIQGPYPAGDFLLTIERDEWWEPEEDLENLEMILWAIHYVPNFRKEGDEFSLEDAWAYVRGRWKAAELGNYPESPPLKPVNNVSKLNTEMDLRIWSHNLVSGYDERMGLKEQERKVAFGLARRIVGIMLDDDLCVSHRAARELFRSIFDGLREGLDK
jgi:hypothetical protein